MMTQVRNAINVIISIVLVGFIGLSLIRLGLFWLHRLG